MPRFTELLNKVWGLEGCCPFLPPPAHRLLSQVWFQRGYRAVGLLWRSGVVLHDIWWCGVRLIRQEKVRK